jgi:hypothetical protein
LTPELGSGQHTDVGLVSEQPVDAGGQEDDLLVDGLSIRCGIGADLQVGGQESVLGAEGVWVHRQPSGVRVADE